jgi:phosphoribosylformylglycinamidine synthase I
LVCSMRYGIVVFPGTWSDGDCQYAVKNILGQDSELLWHNTSRQLSGKFDCIIIPGGFSYGDYLRAGAIAKSSPIMASIQTFASNGGLVLGICNGFQVLCEAKLLPGILVRNDHLTYRCQWTNLLVESVSSPYTGEMKVGQVLKMPIGHGEGNFYADPNTLSELEKEGRVLFRYCTDIGEINRDGNPNGSLNNIAGITNRNGNVLGMMPHPERACEAVLGGTDGALLFKSIIKCLEGG